MRGPIDTSADAVGAAVAGRVHLAETAGGQDARVFPAVLASVSFLGTSSAQPQPGKRNMSSLVVTTSLGSCVMVDCGEGTQHQLMRSSAVKVTKVSAIFITHLHGDHCFGLPGLLCTLGLNGRTAPLPVVGPQGVQELVTTVLRLSGSDDLGFPIVFHELDGTQAHDFTVDLHLGTDKSERLLVHGSPLTHRLPTIGYVLCELAQGRQLDSNKAMAAGARGPALGRLKRGEDVVLDDGTTVRADAVLQDPPVRRAGVFTCIVESQLYYVSPRRRRRPSGPPGGRPGGRPEGVRAPHSHTNYHFRPMPPQEPRSRVSTAPNGSKLTFSESGVRRALCAHCAQQTPLSENV
jgi:ribonuclease Z